MGEREVKSLEAQGQRDDVQEEGTKEEEKYNAYIVTGWNIKTTDEHKGKRIAVGIEGEREWRKERWSKGTGQKTTKDTEWLVKRSTKNKPKEKKEGFWSFTVQMACVCE